MAWRKPDDAQASALSGAKAGYAEMARWAWRNMRGVRRSVALRCLCGAARVGLSLAFVWASRSLVDEAVSPGSSGRSLAAMSALLAGLMLAELAAGLLAKSLSQTAEIKLKSALRLRLFGRVMACRAEAGADSHSADMVSRLAEDVAAFCNLAVTTLPLAAVMLAQFAGALAMFCALSWPMALCVAAMAPAFALAGKVLARRSRQLSADLREAESGMQAAMQESIRHRMAIQAFAAQDVAAGNVRSRLSRCSDAAMAKLRLGLRAQGVSRLGFACCFLTAFIWSIWQLHAGLITFGSMTAFLQLVARMQAPVASLAAQLPAAAHAAASVDRLMAIDALPVEAACQPLPIGPEAGVRFSNVSFRYPGADKDALAGFTFDFKPGSKTVVTGPTGIGKTTLARLALGQLLPQRGSVEIYADGLSHPAGPSTRNAIAYVPQGNSLLAGTVRDNLLMACPAATDSDISEALRAAAADFAYGLPQGIDTPCGEGGCKLSEGQAQRIAIARALLRKCPVIILDEYNSALDKPTAATIADRLLASRSASTIIIIAHRFEASSPFDTVSLDNLSQ